MSFKLQHLAPESKFCQHLRMPLLETYYPRELVSHLLSRCQAWEQRERKLSQLVMVYYVIALSLFRQCNVTQVFAHLSRGLRWVWPDPCLFLPTAGALPCTAAEPGKRGDASALPAVLPSARQTRDQGSLCLRLAADGHR